MTLPDPLVPSYVDLRDFPFTPVYRAALFSSTFHAKATDAEWRAGVTLWLKSWDQVPAGTLPNDDVVLCRLAELGADLRAWRKIKERALHGWFQCADGRLHHKVVAEGVMDAWNRKVAQRERTERARLAKLEKRLAKETDPAEQRRLQAMIDAIRQTLSHADCADVDDAPTDQVAESVTDNVTDSKRQGQRQGQGSNNVVVSSAAGAANNNGTDLIEAFDEAVVATWGEQARRTKPHATDGKTAREWAAAGLSKALAAKVFREHCGKMRELGTARPPWSLKCFADDVRVALAAASVSAPAEAGEGRENDVRATWRARLVGYAKGLHWSTSWGEKPGERGCDAPADLVAEIIGDARQGVAL